MCFFVTYCKAFSIFQKVTIAGESAGSMSVLALYLSKAAEGLFHRAIAQSGVLNIPMLYQTESPINHFKYVYVIFNLFVEKSKFQKVFVRK